MPCSCAFEQEPFLRSASFFLPSGTQEASGVENIPTDQGDLVVFATWTMRLACLRRFLKSRHQATVGHNRAVNNGPVTIKSRSQFVMRERHSMTARKPLASASARFRLTLLLWLLAACARSEKLGKASECAALLPSSKYCPWWPCRALHVRCGKQNAPRGAGRCVSERAASVGGRRRLVQAQVEEAVGIGRAQTRHHGQAAA